MRNDSPLISNIESKNKNGFYRKGIHQSYDSFLECIDTIHSINKNESVLLIDDLKTHYNEIKSLEREVTLFHVNVVNQIIETSKTEVDLLGFHGQTIFHNAKKKNH